MQNTPINAMPSANGYSVNGGPKHSLLRFAAASAIKWINPVAIITPLPKYFIASNIHRGTLNLVEYAANKGVNDPKAETTNRTGTDETLASQYFPL